jgi:hypothetical protein
MRIGMEITGDREVSARLAKLKGDMTTRVKGAVGTSAQSIQYKAVMHGSFDTKVTLDGDGMGAAVGPLPPSEKTDEDGAIFKAAMEKAVGDVVGE